MVKKIDRTLSIQHRPLPDFGKGNGEGAKDGNTGQSSISVKIAQQAREREDNRQLRNKLVELQAQNEALLRNGNANLVTLKLLEGREVVFERVRFEPHEIESQTFVNHLNGRDQRFVTASSVADIVNSLGLGGQIYAAIGVRSEDGRVLILAGSRRRRACIVAKHPYDVLISPVMLQPADIEFLSSASNYQKPLSILDVGLRWAELLESTFNKDRSALAAAYGVTKMTVSRALKAANLPPQWISLLPDVSCLTHTIVSKLTQASSKLSSKQIDEVAAIVNSNNSQRPLNNVENDELTDVIVADIVSVAEKLPPENLVPGKSRGGRPAPKPLLAQGSKVISLQSTTSKAGNHSIQLKGTDLTDNERDLLIKGIEALVSQIKSPITT
ncbi:MULTISPECIES: ParB N-terminal domain-containing protein [Aeromonas]|uniref:ParB N-terminal domain-containing protein n=1 Tax=Aeromonas TaxID=642 RepID=UPI001455DC50|nr:MULTISPECIES: ParB N-terminal domain-containing protein [Aeromonas]